MRDFTFLSPTRLIVGKGTELETGKWVKKYGGTKVLVHHDSGYAKECGLVDKVIKSITDEGIEVIELGGVVPNPRLSKIYEGLELGKKENIDFIIAVGGGSVIDSAKGIALGIPYDGDVWDFFVTDENGVPKAVPEASIPKGVVLTMPASGSEGSSSVVVTKEDENLKRNCDTDLHRSTFVIENPELTLSLSRYQTACGVLDIMSHSMERYFTKDSGNELTDRLCEAIFHTCLTCGRALMHDLNDYDARANIMVAGTISHNGLVGMGREEDWATHMLEHEFSGEYDVTHGVGLAVLLPAWMKYVYKEHQEIFIKFATRVMGADMNWSNPELTILEGIDRFEKFIEDLGLATHISGIKNMPEVTEEAMWKMAKRARVSNDIGTIGWFKKLSYEDMVNIFKLAM